MSLDLDLDILLGFLIEYTNSETKFQSKETIDAELEELKTINSLSNIFNI